MSISQLYPEEGPTLNLNFAGSKTLDPRITFTRTSTATYMDDSGLIKVAPADSPRFDHRYVNGEIESLGLLVEESRSNLLTYSNDYSASPGGWTLSSTGTRAQDIVGPDGVANSAWTITDNDNTGDLVRFYKEISITASSSTNYCISSFVKDVNGTGISPEFYVFFTGSSTKGSYIKYNFSTDTITSFASDGGGIQPTIYGRIFYPNGWVRIYFVVNDANSGSNTNLQYRIYPNGRGANTTGAIGLYGSQIEIGTFPTSYIPRPDASTATRNPDNVSMTGDNFSDWYNPTEGTIVLDCTPVYDNSSNQYRRLLSIHNNSGAQTDTIQFLQTEASNQVGCAVWDGSSFQTGFGKTLLSGTRYKVAFAVKENNMNASYDGSISTDDISATLPVMTRMDIGKYQTSSTLQTTAHFNRITYYPTRLTNTQLQTLTK